MKKDNNIWLILGIILLAVLVLPKLGLFSFTSIDSNLTSTEPDNIAQMKSDLESNGYNCVSKTVGFECLKGDAPALMISELSNCSQVLSDYSNYIMEYSQQNVLLPLRLKNHTSQWYNDYTGASISNYKGRDIFVTIHAPARYNNLTDSLEIDYSKQDYSGSFTCNSANNIGVGSISDQVGKFDTGSSVKAYIDLYTGNDYLFKIGDFQVKLWMVLAGFGGLVVLILISKK